MTKHALLLCTEGMTFAEQPPQLNREALRTLVRTVLGECGIEAVDRGKAKTWAEFVALLEGVSGVVQLDAWQGEPERNLAVMAEMRGKPTLAITAEAIDKSEIRHAVIADLWAFADMILQGPSTEVVRN